MSPCGPSLCCLLSLFFLSGNEAAFISLALYCIAQKKPWNPLLNFSFLETLPAFIFWTAFPVAQFSPAVISFSQMRLRSHCGCDQKDTGLLEIERISTKDKLTSDIHPEPNDWNFPQHVCLNPELYSVKWHSIIGDPVEMKGLTLGVCVMRPHDTVVPCALFTVITYIYACRRSPQPNVIVTSDECPIDPAVKGWFLMTHDVLTLQLLLWRNGRCFSVFISVFFFLLLF